jgi:hypothetical protein
LLLHTSYLPLGVPNGLVNHHAQGRLLYTHITIGSSNLFLAPLPGRKEDFCEGSFRTHILYFVLLFCFTLFILPALLLSKTQKN